MAACLFMALGWAEPADAQSFRVLHHFAFSDGSDSFELAASQDTLYGTLEYGGSGDDGAIFAVGTNGIFTNLYSFTTRDVNTSTNRDGAYPEAGLITDGGTLYGTTTAGGAGNGGTIFALSMDGKNFRVLHQFTELNPVTEKNADGSSPAGQLILSNGVLYGTTIYGGSSAYGTVFEIGTNGLGFSVLHNFAGGTGGTDGANPHSGLAIAGNTLYGTTTYGGVGFGTIFAVTTDSHFTNLYSFTDQTDGGYPYTSLALTDNTLFGTMSMGGNAGFGLVFAVGTDGSNFRTVHSFTAGTFDSDNNFTNSDGLQPIKGLTLAGNQLFGSAESGGSHGQGTVFVLNTNGSNFTVLHNFTPTDPSASTNSDGASPYGRVNLIGNTVYGTTDLGGTEGDGTVFSIAVSTPGQPQLTIDSIGAEKVVLTWPDTFSGFTLQSSVDINPTGWNDVTSNPLVINGQNTVTNSATGDHMFYRLRQ